MSGIHLRSNTLVLWLTLSAAVAASAVGVGCSSSDSDAGGTAGKGGGGAPATAGSGNGEAGEAPVGVGGDTGEGGSVDVPSGGRADTGGSGGSVAGGPSGEAGVPGEGGSGGSPDEVEEDPAVVAAQARALELIAGLSEKTRCAYCHNTEFQGLGFYPNITPDEETGIGTWSDEQIKTAIRAGKDKDGVTLCATMERYPFTDDQVSDLVVFLKHLPPVVKKITAKCPVTP
jgi:hypothetical protein